MCTLVIPGRVRFKFPRTEVKQKFLRILAKLIPPCKQSSVKQTVRSVGYEAFTFTNLIIKIMKFNYKIIVK